MGELMDIAPQVRLVLDGFSRGIGTNNRCQLRWDRTGAATFNLIGQQPDQWTAQNIYGRLGRFSAECANLAVTVNNPYLQYELDNADLKLTAGIELPGFADRLVPAGKVGASDASGAQPVGAVGLMTVFSVLSIVWALLHPRATLNLPGTIELDAVMMSANTLNVTFKTPPAVTVVWGLQFSCSPSELVLTERSVEVKYKAGWLARSKRWEW